MTGIIVSLLRERTTRVAPHYKSKLISSTARPPRRAARRASPAAKRGGIWSVRARRDNALRRGIPSRFFGDRLFIEADDAGLTEDHVADDLQPSGDVGHVTGTFVWARVHTFHDQIRQVLRDGRFNLVRRRNHVVRQQ